MAATRRYSPPLLVRGPEEPKGRYASFVTCINPAPVEFQSEGTAEYQLCQFKWDAVFFTRSLISSQQYLGSRSSFGRESGGASAAVPPNDERAGAAKGAPCCRELRVCIVNTAAGVLLMVVFAQSITQQRAQLWLRAKLKGMLTESTLGELVKQLHPLGDLDVVCVGSVCDCSRLDREIDVEGGGNVMEEASGEGASANSSGRRTILSLPGADSPPVVAASLALQARDETGTLQTFRDLPRGSTPELPVDASTTWFKATAGGGWAPGRRTLRNIAAFEAMADAAEIVGFDGSPGELHGLGVAALDVEEIETDVARAKMCEHEREAWAAKMGVTDDRAESCGKHMHPHVRVEVWEGASRKKRRCGDCDGCGDADANVSYVCDRCEVELCVECRARSLTRAANSSQMGKLDDVLVCVASSLVPVASSPPEGEGRNTGAPCEIDLCQRYLAFAPPRPGAPGMDVTSEGRPYRKAILWSISLEPQETPFEVIREHREDRRLQLILAAVHDSGEVHSKRAGLPAFLRVLPESGSACVLLSDAAHASKRLAEEGKLPGIRVGPTFEADRNRFLKRALNATEDSTKKRRTWKDIKHSKDPADRAEAKSVQRILSYMTGDPEKKCHECAKETNASMFFVFSTQMWYDAAAPATASLHDTSKRVCFCGSECERQYFEQLICRRCGEDAKQTVRDKSTTFPDIGELLSRQDDVATVAFEAAKDGRRSFEEKELRRANRKRLGPAKDEVRLEAVLARLREDDGKVREVEVPRCAKCQGPMAPRRPVTDGCHRESEIHSQF